VTEYLPEDKKDDVSESISGKDTYNNTEYEEATKEREKIDSIEEKSEIMEFFEGKKTHFTHCIFSDYYLFRSLCNLYLLLLKEEKEKITN